MPVPRVERKLVAIVSADIEAYSRHMSADEVGTLRTLTAHRGVTDASIQQYRGRIVGTAGDSILAEFASAVDAVQCAVEIQRELKIKNAELSEHRRMEFRIGINVGDVIVEGNQIYGDGVNVAARLQGLADAGGIFISGTVYDQVKNKLALEYEYLGEQEVKNIPEPVRVYRVVLEEAAAVSAREETSPQSKVESPRSAVESPRSKGASPKPRRVGSAHLRWVVVGVVLLAGTIAAVRYFSLPTPNPQPLTPSPAPPLSPQDSALRTAPALSPQDSALRTEAALAALPSPDKPSLVVLPLDNLSKDPEQDYFSDGLTEDLTSDLSQISSLFVISRNTAFTYKGKAVKLPEVSRELGVQYVVEGSVRKAGDQVRITVQLIDATTDPYLWSGRYDRPLSEIFALQDEIRQKIMTALKVKLTPEEHERFQRAPTNNLEAYDFLLRGGGVFAPRIVREEERSE
jgi:TolB-like protein/class 3 adenylate cyclase